MVKKPAAMKSLRENIANAFTIMPILLILAFLLAPGLCMADVSVSLDASPNRVQTGDVFNLSVTVSGAGSADDIQLRGTNGLEVGRPGQSSRTSIVNGRIDRSITYTYGISAPKTGTYTLGPAIVTIGGKQYGSNTARVTVDPLGEIKGRENDAMFFTAEVLPKQAYAGQDILCRVRFYWSIPLRDIQFEGFPDIENLEFSQIGDSRQFQKTINGKAFNVAELVHQVIPSATGDYEIPPLAVKAEVIKSSGRPSRFPRGFFDDQFFGNEQVVKTRVLSEPVSFSVKALPTEGAPGGFNGLIGRFSIQADLDPKEVKAGDSATLTVTLSGRGNVQLLPDLDLPPLPGVKVYPSDPQLEDNRDGQGPFGKKTMQWALVPQTEGDVAVPAFSVPYFNTGTGKYEYAKTREINLHVLPGAVHAAPAPTQEMQVNSASKHRVQMLGEDILKIHETPKAVAPGMGQTMPVWLGVLIIGFPFLPLAGALIIRSGGEKRAQQAGVRASKKAYAAFAKAVRDLGADKSVEAFRALQEYLALRLGLEAATLTSHEAEEKMLAAGVDPESASRLKQVFSRLETCVFSQCGSQFSPEVRQELLDVVRAVDKKVKV